MEWEVSQGGEVEYEGPLIGAPGSDYVASVLGGWGDPVRALKDIQRRGSFRDKR